jgi:hypothetical protein
VHLQHFGSSPWNLSAADRLRTDLAERGARRRSRSRGHEHGTDRRGGAIGKQVLTALQIWRDDVNAKGGLLGRPVELVFYDDQSNPTNIPQLNTKLIEVDKV